MTVSAKDRIAAHDREYAEADSAGLLDAREAAKQYRQLATSLAEELDRRNAGQAVTLDSMYDAGTWALSEPGSPLAEAEHRQRVEAIGLKDCLLRVAQLQEELDREREARAELEREWWPIDRITRSWNSEPYKGWLPDVELAELRRLLTASHERRLSGGRPKEER